VGTTSSDRPRTRRRLVLAGLLSAAVLTGGAGAAYAANAGDGAVETGYAVVVDGDCPDGTAEGIDVAVRAQGGGDR
jgi:hypothetical protein